MSTDGAVNFLEKFRLSRVVSLCNLHSVDLIFHRHMHERKLKAHRDKQCRNNTVFSALLTILIRPY